MDKAKKARRRNRDLQEMSLSQVLSAIAYTAGDTACYTCNGLLRDMDEARCKFYRHHLMALQSFCRKRASRNRHKRKRVLYRGAMLPRKLLADYRTGKILLWPAFTSTTTDVSVARSFGGNGGGDDSTASVLFEIRNALCCPVEDISMYPHEKEFLLPCFSGFTVISVKDVDGGRRRPVRITLAYKAFDDIRESVLQDSKLRDEKDTGFHSLLTKLIDKIDELT